VISVLRWPSVRGDTGLSKVRHAVRWLLETVRFLADANVLWVAVFGTGGSITWLGVVWRYPSAFFPAVRPAWAGQLLAALVGTLVVALITIIVLGIGFWWHQRQNKRLRSELNTCLPALDTAKQQIGRYRAAEAHFKNLAVLNAQTDVHLFWIFVELLKRIRQLGDRRRPDAERIADDIKGTLRNALHVIARNMTEILNSASQMCGDYTNTGSMVAAYTLVESSDGTKVRFLECDQDSVGAWVGEMPLRNLALANAIATAASKVFATTDLADSQQIEALVEIGPKIKGLLILPIKAFDVNHKFGDKVVGFLYVRYSDGNLGTEVMVNYGQELAARLSVMFYRVDMIHRFDPSISI
jgi:hypothetical protein